MEKVIKNHTISIRKMLIVNSINLVSPYCLRLDSRQVTLTLLVRI